MFQPFGNALFGFDPRKPNPPFIVAEITKNWTRGMTAEEEFAKRDCLGQKFEDCIEFNRERGYRLHSFQLHQLLVSEDAMTETIIAVFERVPARPGKEKSHES